MAPGRRHASENHVDTAAEQVGHRGSAPSIRHMQHVNAGAKLQEFARHVRHGAETGAAEG